MLDKIIFGGGILLVSLAVFTGAFCCVDIPNCAKMILILIGIWGTIISIGIFID